MIKKSIKKNIGPAQDKVKNFRSGFVVLFAATLSSILLSIALSVSNIAYKEIKFGSSARSSNEAFFAADAGIECALFNDKTTSDVFTPNNGPAEDCFNQSVVFFYYYPSSSSKIWEFVITRLGGTGKSCVNVKVLKQFDSDISATSIVTSTTIVAKGYNLGGDNDVHTCTSSSNNRVEREIKTTY